MSLVRLVAIDEETATAETAYRDFMGARDCRREPGRQPNREVVLGQSAGQVAEGMEIARLNGEARDRLTDRFLAPEVLDCEAGLAVQIREVHPGERRQEEVYAGAGLVDDLHATGQRRAQTFERADGIWSADMGGAATLSARPVRVRAYDRDLVQGRGAKRKNAVIGEQYE